MLNKKKISALIFTVFCMNQVHAVNDNLSANGSAPIPVTSTPAKEEKLNVLNAGKKKEDSAYEQEMKTLNEQYQRLILQHKIKQAELSMKKTEQDIKDLDNPVKKDTLTVPSPSNLPAGLNIPALSMPKFDMSTGAITVAKPISDTTNTVKKYKKKAVKKDAQEEKPVIKEVPYAELPVVKGYGGFASSMQATLVYANGSENQVQVGDVVMPNVTISAINEKGVFVKNVTSEMKLAMWSKMINNKAKEEAKPMAEPLMQPPASGPIIYPGITPSISGELKPLIQGNGEIIIPKTVGSYK